MAHFLRVTRLCLLLELRVDAVRMRFFPTNVSTILWAEPGFASKDIALLHRILKPGDLVVDVGANVGHLALVSSSIVGEGGRVIAIEAHPTTFKYLTMNIEYAGQKNVSAHNFAIGASNGFVNFSSQRADDQNHISSGDDGASIAMKPLDDLLHLVEGRIALLKIDVEGYELMVLQGASRTLARTDCLVFEVSPEMLQRFGCRPADVIGLLRNQGYLVGEFAGENLVREVDECYTRPGCMNLIAFASGAVAPFEIERLG